MAAPYSNLRSKLDRAIVAYLISLADPKVGTAADILPAYMSSDKPVLSTVVQSSQGPEDPPFTGNHNMAVKVRIKVPAANQPGQTNPMANRVVLDARSAATFDAFHQTANNCDYGETARLISAAGRALATSGTVTDQANNADMVDFTCQWIQDMSIAGGEPDDEATAFVDVITFSARCCPSNTD